jgi:hypothetical protein
MTGHVLMWWSPKGYRLEERDGDAPAVGERVGGDGDGDQVVQKVGASPLPGDARPCAYLAPEPASGTGS